ncbi:hypothetical protein Clacol_002319 [Clathrus columnatus]|uniref:NLE domain-containing protein n=1 Tax=Clathrus columnatus TaxID=1419009 RepID=A0AAV5A510_9AGAM|nr:hypothetical protein Clacol_002319 [Clathrus columnatus]
MADQETTTTTTTVTSHPAFFTTKTEHVLPAQKYFIPDSWRRYQLSQLINKVLSLDQSIPFDFLIRGEVLRGSIAEWCAEHGIGEEETLEIEYIKSLMPPQRMASIPQKDWISSVSCKIPESILAGSYDANIYIFDASQKPVHTISGHTAPVTSVCWVGGLLFLKRMGTRPFRVKSRTSWDAVIGVWNTGIPDVDQVPLEEVGEERKKRRKVASEEERPVRKGPEEVMKSHTNRVTRALFSPLSSSNNLAYSCGLDSTVRTWDTSAGLCISTMTLPERPFTDIAVQADGNIVVAASTDRTASVLDLRTSNTSSAPILSFSFSSLPSTLVAHPADERRFMSGSYDGIVRIWDIRSPKVAVAHFKSEKGGKILSTDWRKGMGVLGGEDGVEIWQIGEGGDTAL